MTNRLTKFYLPVFVDKDITTKLGPGKFNSGPVELSKVVKIDPLADNARYSATPTLDFIPYAYLIKSYRIY